MKAHINNLQISSTAKRLKEYMDTHDIKPVDIINLVTPICKKYGVRLEKNDLSQYLSGKTRPGQDKLLVLSEALGVDVAWLMGTDVPMERAKDKVPNNLIPIDQNTRFVKIPVIGRVAAGNGCFIDEDILDYEITEEKDIEQGEIYRYLKVSGDSMEPKIEDGDLLLVRQQSSVDSGSVAIVSIDDMDGVVKRINYGPGWIELKSINPKYPPRVFEGADVLRIRVLGLVKQIRRKL